MSNECMQNKSAEQMTLAFGLVKGHKKQINNSAPHLGTRKTLLGVTRRVFHLLLQNELALPERKWLPRDVWEAGVGMVVASLNSGLILRVRRGSCS